MRVFWRIKRLVKKVLLMEDEFLCDTCKYDYGDACTLPQRPNAIECDHYERR